MFSGIVAGIASVTSGFYFLFFFLMEILGVKPRTLGMLSICSTTKLYPTPMFFVFLNWVLFLCVCNFVLSLV